MQFHILSFEGPDPYSTVGGLATRVGGLTEALANMGLETHLWFVGDPDLAAHETQGHLHLHRWCQWISEHHREGGVYAGEHGKAVDFSTSLPPFMLHRGLLQHLLQGGHAVVMAEEWQTVNAVLHLDWLLRKANLRKQVTIFWTANNTFGFEQIRWNALQRAANIATVSRYMKYRMEPFGISPIVIPNGLSPDAYLPPERTAVAALRRNLRDRTVVSKMARWDPDKRWIPSMKIVSELKQRGMQPLFIARGGTEPYGADVKKAAQRAGLRFQERENTGGSTTGALGALCHLEDVDVVFLTQHVDPNARRVLFKASDVVLANSSHEPFGLVGLEAMAVGGIACTGCSGEDYAISGRNALVLQSENPNEFMELFKRLHSHPKEASAMRRAGRSTARHYAWPEVIDRSLMPQVELARSAHVLQ